VRVDLAACYRLCALKAWDDLIYTHISATVPGKADHFRINPFGLRFDEITASNLVKIDLHGNMIGDQASQVNVLGFAIATDFTDLTINYKGTPMPTINVQLFEGRTVEQKRAFVKAVTEATVATLDCSAESVDIIIEDVKRENWATGGKLWSESD